MNPLGRFNLSSFAPAAVLVAGLALMLLSPGAWRMESLAISLQLASATQPTQTSTQVSFVDIDEASLAAAGAWPWPRTQIAQLVQTVAAAEPETILLILPFSGPDAAAPQRAIEAWIATGAGRAGQGALSRAPDTDAVLLEVMGQSGAILALYPGEGTPPDALTQVVFDQDESVGFLSDFSFVASGPIAGAPITRAPLALKQDVFGRPTGAYLIVQSDEAALATATALPLSQGADDALRATSDGRPGMIAFFDPVGIRMVEGTNGQVPTLSDGSILFRRDLSVPALSASDVLDGTVGDLIRGRTVVIGSTLPRVNEGGDTLAPGLSTAQAAALAAAQVAAGTSPARPFVYLWIEFLVALVLGAVIISLAQAKRHWIGFGLGVFGASGAFGASIYLLTQQGTLLDSAAMGLVLVLTASVGLAVGESGRQTTRQRLGHAVQGKLPFGVPARMNRNPRRLLDHAESRKITALCCAIRAFEELQDLYKDDPDGFAGIVQQFQELVGDHVRRLGGTVDRIGGGTILAFWNAPLDDPDHALTACDCALRLVDGLEHLNQMIEGQAYRTGKPFAPIHIGIGINTGRAVAGNVGSLERPAYSLIGETVTVAQKLQQGSNAYGPAIIVGEHTYQAVKNRFALLEIDKIEIPHRTYTVRVFALLGNPVTKASPRFRALEDAHEAIFDAYRTQNWSLAEALIAECRKLNGAIPSLYDLYDRRIAFYRQFPPDPDWDGAFSAPVL